MDGIVFVGAVVVAVVDAVKSLFPDVKGAFTVLAAAVVGALLSLVDVELGITNLTVAEGVMAGLAASGAVSVAKRVGDTSEPTPLRNKK